MKSLPLPVRLRHWIITSRWQRWLFPLICLVPYVLILFWILSKGLIWVAQVLLAPVVMGVVLGAMTYLLAQAEFRRSSR